MAVDLPTDPERREGSAPGVPEWDEVRRAARGQRRDYRLEARHLAVGGQAAVFRGVHKPTRCPVAFKRLLARDESSVARMRREIEAARRFGDGRHVMPVLDADPGHTWFVMPLASGTATTLAEELTDSDRVRALVTAVCEALRPAHAEGWVHRDLKPDNVLWHDGRWVVADWGLGRRPRGRTSDQRRTAAGVRFGTDGFAAPELSVSAHDVGPQADVFSIGQLIGWALTGSWPLANVPLLPDAGPWRTVVRDATAFDPADRPADCDALLALVAAELDAPAESAVAEGRRLLAAATAGDASAPGAILRLAARAGADWELFEHVVVELGEDHLRAAATADLESLRAVASAARELPGGAAWLVAVARVAEENEDWDLLRDAADSAVRLGGDEQARETVRTWLLGLSGTTARVAAAAVRAYPDARAWFADLAAADSVDHRLRQAVLPARSRPGTPRSATGPDPISPRTRRRWPIATAVALTTAMAVGVTWWVNQDNAAPRGAGGGAASSTTTSSAVREPSEQAATPQLRNFVRPWDAYPAWRGCRPGTEGTSVDGTYPAAPDLEPLRPNHTFSCDNGGSLTVMFAEYFTVWYNEALARYRSAPPPRTPAFLEAQPPDGLHVFRWSDTQRALVWSDDEARTIGIAITNSAGTDLVELWEKYRGP